MRKLRLRKVICPRPNVAIAIYLTPYLIGLHRKLVNYYINKVLMIVRNMEEVIDKR
jgi:hypothetical protein